MKFNISSVPESIAQDMVNKLIWQKDCPIKIERLRLLEISHYNFENQVSVGQLMVLDKISEATLNIFRELFELNFPIHTIKLINEFNGDDELSMSANNSSCFNFRKIEGTDKISMHSYGLAIDINPIQNPFIVIDDVSDNVKIFPKEGANFLNRRNLRSGMVEPIIEIFKKHGFSQWGGEWNAPIDYHHFQVPKSLMTQLLE